MLKPLFYYSESQGNYYSDAPLVCSACNSLAKETIFYIREIRIKDPEQFFLCLQCFRGRKTVIEPTYRDVRQIMIDSELPIDCIQILDFNLMFQSGTIRDNQTLKFKTKGSWDSNMKPLSNQNAAILDKWVKQRIPENPDRYVSFKDAKIGADVSKELEALDAPIGIADAKNLIEELFNATPYDYKLDLEENKAKALENHKKLLGDKRE